MLGRRQKWDKVAIIFILPWFIFFCSFTFYPVFMALLVSTNEWNLFEGTFRWIGFSQYLKLFHDAKFYQCLWNNFVYLGIQVPLSIFGGILIAVLLNQKVKGRIFFRGIFFLPIITGIVVLVIIWSWMFSTGGGVINYFLGKVHLPPVPWLIDPRWSMPSIALMKVWTDVAFYGVLFLGALQGIPQSLFEVAKIDGASQWHIFWRITLPLLNPAIVFAVIMGTIWGMQIFTEPLLMTEGGPLGSSTPLTLFLYRQGFTWGRYSYACAIGIVTSLLILLFSMIERKFIERVTLY